MEKDEKRECLREEALRRREKLPSHVQCKLNRRIAAGVVGWIEENSIDVVMLYLSMQSEVDTQGVFNYLLTHHKIALAPVMEMKRRTLVPYRVTNLDVDLVRHRYGMFQPDRDSSR